MEKIRDKVIRIWKEEGILKEINLLTDMLLLDKHDNCQAGENTFVLSPAGKIYTCCAEYLINEHSFIGDIKEGIIKEYGARLHKIENSNLCRNCDAYQCKNCVYINRKNTKEYNVSPSFQCRKSHIERAISLELKNRIEDCEVISAKSNFDIKTNDFLDPIVEFFKSNNDFKGYYKYRG